MCCFFIVSYLSPHFQVLPTISIIFNVLAVIAVALSSVDSIKEKDKFGNIRENILLSRLTMVCFTWISIEWLMRMYSAPRISQFIFDICTIIDLLGCVLYFYTVIVNSKNQSTSTGSSSLMSASSDRLSDAWKMFLMFRSWKIPYMICKLLYDPSVLQLDRAILFNFNKQFGILFLFFITGVVMSSTAIYVAEKDIKDSPFTSIPETFWFAVATLTTSGNSFAYPTSTLGKYFTSLCSLVGVIFIAAVITIANFAKVLQNINQNRLTTHNAMRQQGASSILPANAAGVPASSNYLAPSNHTQMLNQQHQQQIHPASGYSGAHSRLLFFFFFAFACLLAFFSSSSFLVSALSFRLSRLPASSSSSGAHITSTRAQRVTCFSSPLLSFSFSKSIDDIIITLTSFCFHLLCVSRTHSRDR